MLRSLAAAIIAVIVGLTAAKLVEALGAGLAGAAPAQAAYAGILAASWFAGAFIAGVVALLIARRWAPVGMIASSAIFLSAFAALISAPLAWIAWPASVLATALGGLAAIKATGARFAPPQPAAKEGFLDG